MGMRGCGWVGGWLWAVVTNPRIHHRYVSNYNGALHICKPLPSVWKIAGKKRKKKRKKKKKKKREKKRKKKEKGKRKTEKRKKKKKEQRVCRLSNYNLRGLPCLLRTNERTGGGQEPNPICWVQYTYFPLTQLSLTFSTTTHAPALHDLAHKPRSPIFSLTRRETRFCFSFYLFFSFSSFFFFLLPRPHSRPRGITSPPVSTCQPVCLFTSAALSTPPSLTPCPGNPS